MSEISTCRAFSVPDLHFVIRFEPAKSHQIFGHTTMERHERLSADDKQCLSELEIWQVVDSKARARVSCLM